MDYKSELIAKLNDINKGPLLFERPDYLDSLYAIADRAYVTDTIEGYLASLLIFQQLIEEIIRLLLRNARFLLQLRAYPNEIVFHEKKNQTFGQVIEELKYSISFKNKDEIIKTCEELNKYRIEFLHNLTKQTTDRDIARKIHRVKDIYWTIYRLTVDASKDFRIIYQDYKNLFSANN
jgi:hypothetical protein